MIEVMTDKGCYFDGPTLIHTDVCDCDYYEPEAWWQKHPTVTED